ncbi:MAG: US12 family protein [Spirochaetes bacterium]|nr:US12 family protein [Spirochaetota bacterium]
MDTTYSDGNVVAGVSADARAEFIRKTYLHLALAILAFVGLEYVLLKQSFVPALVQRMVSGYMWLAVLGAFMAVSWVADRWARSSTSRGIQYLGLGLYVVAEAVIFLPLLYVASNFFSKDVIPTAAIITGLLFVGLTFVVFTTRKDFTFLGGILKIGFFVALGVIGASILFGFSLGLIFSAAMVVMAAGSILYTTSAIMKHYGTEQYVAASLSLFASVALLFWYILRIVMALSRD